MKKLFYVIALVLGLSLSAAASPGKSPSASAGNSIVTKTVELVAFDKIIAKGKFDIKYVQGEQNVKVCGPEASIKKLKFEVSAGVLTIDAGKSTFLRDDLVIFICTPELKSVRIEGAGDFEAKQGIKTRDLSLNISGAGDIEVKNLDAEDVKISINGAGDIDVEYMLCESIDVVINGAGDVDLEDIDCNDFSANINGAGSADVSGHAREARLVLNGAGSIDVSKLSCDNLNSKINGMGKIKR